MHTNWLYVNNIRQKTSKRALEKPCRLSFTCCLDRWLTRCFLNNKLLLYIRIELKLRTTDRFGYHQSLHGAAHLKEPPLFNKPLIRLIDPACVKARRVACSQ